MWDWVIYKKKRGNSLSSQEGQEHSASDDDLMAVQLMAEKWRGRRFMKGMNVREEQKGGCSAL